MEAKREIRKEQCQDGWMTNSLSFCRRSHCSGLRPLLCRKSGTADQGYQIRKEHRKRGRKNTGNVEEYTCSFFSYLFFLLLGLTLQHIVNNANASHHGSIHIKKVWTYDYKTKAIQ